MPAQIDAFSEEEVDFEMPEGVADWQDNSTVKLEDGVARKTTRRTLQLADGSEQVLEKTTERVILTDAPANRHLLAVPSVTRTALSPTAEKELDTPERILDDLAIPNEEAEMIMISDALNTAEPADKGSRNASRN